MRIVLIIQSLIILLGAYYVYTLTRPSFEATDRETATSTIEINELQREAAEDTTAEDEDNVTVQQDADGVIIMEGHNDMGMEFPIPDADTFEVR